MAKIDVFRMRCVQLGNKHAPDCIIRAEEFDYGCFVGAAIELPDGRRHGVRGPYKAYYVYPPWWAFWRKKLVVLPITPESAMAELVKWVILNG